MKINKFLITVFASLFFVYAFAPVVKMQSITKIESSAVKFKIKNAGFNVDGSFGKVSGTIKFDPNKSTGNIIDVSIDANSINTTNSSRDKHLRGSDYFDVSKFPKISMKATMFSKDKDGNLKGFFKLTLKDKTKDIVLPLTVTNANGKTTLKTIFSINRLDYGVGSSSMMLSNLVYLTIETTLND